MDVGAAEDRVARAPSPPAADEVLLVTGRSVVVEQVLRLAAAEGVRVRVAEDVAAAGSLWRDAGTVLLGDDAAARGVPLRRSGVLLVAPSGTDDAGGGARLWRAAVDAGAAAVAELPDQAPLVASALAAAAEGPGLQGRLVGVVGACGGAGASVLAAAVARAAPPRTTLLVDADPVGGGADLLLGVHDEPGLRWPDLLGAGPRLRAAALRDGLPRTSTGLPVLAWSAGPGEEPWGTVPPGGAVPADSAEAVVAAAARASDLVVVDLPRTGRAVEPLLWQLDLLVVLVPAQLRAVTAAQALLPGLVGPAGDVRLVVSTRPGAPLAPDDVADALALPLLDHLGHGADVRAALGRGEPLPRPRGALARCARSVLRAVDALDPRDAAALVSSAPGAVAATGPRSGRGRRRRA
ncbi:septum site-determining protein Ssd [Quadrisphaera sp. INWT6]|uniref:septum site-determining protein Ssd n=1 Tax=Quadrisphaera sp. INWT6 TaxID=2596917 RepID=UPI001891FB7E|nr:septum site-determining protein Ssd [Quadrisphaera sp. INWT6]